MTHCKPRVSTSFCAQGEPRALREMSWIKRLEMLRDVAAGMHYLHTRRPSVIHGDLRSPNLLLDLTMDNNRPRFHVKVGCQYRG